MTTNACFGNVDGSQLIIFVHGLTGDAIDTWLNRETGFSFPKALSDDLLDSYVVSFGYKSLFRQGDSVQKIAEELALVIYGLRERHKYQTLKFVGHSMGGIIAREYILHYHLKHNADMDVTHVICLGIVQGVNEKPRDALM